MFVGILRAAGQSVVQQKSGKTNVYAEIQQEYGDIDSIRVNSIGAVETPG
jgi:hypothetical protein